VAVIDHWVNYIERFIFDGDTILPDALWVTDEHAAHLARAIFGSCPIFVKPNFYLEEQAARLVGRSMTAGDILYVAEPARSNWGRGTPGEFQMLDYFMAHRERLGIAPDIRLRLRPHPSDELGKYDAWLTANAGRVVALDQSRDLAEALAGAEWVIGGQSFALVVALAAGRKAVSALPPWAPPCALPHESLIHLRRLVSSDRSSLAEM
jgi:hypothetical protein